MNCNFFDWFLLSALAIFAGLGISRAFLLQCRGIRINAFGQPSSQRLLNLLNAAVPLARSYEIVAFTWPLRFHLFPQSSELGNTLINFLPLKIFGVFLWTSALILYGVAVRTMGRSWRIGVARDVTIPLVTHGIFQWTRNPIYLSFAFMAVGTFCILSKGVFLLLSVVSLALLRNQILREERFLMRTYGENYRTYCSRVGRYLKWF